MVSSFQVLSQGNGKEISKRPLNNISLHAFGDVALFAVYYERLFQLSNVSFLTGSAGVGLFPEINFFESEPSAPNVCVLDHITANFGKRKALFEIGLGGTYLNDPGESHYFIYPIVGFRLQPFNSGKANLRVFFSYPIGDSQELPIPPFGLSAGICF